MKIEGTVALVTGANRGIGSAFVEELLARGVSTVYAGARNADSVALSDPRVVAVTLDVTDPGACPPSLKSCPTCRSSSTTLAS